jgi:hypothetical protein
MHMQLRKSLSFTLALLLASTPLIRAQQTTTAAPIPQQITSAQKIFISNGGGSNYFDQFSGGPDRGYSSLYNALQQWNRYQFVGSPSEADLIFQIRSIAPAVDVPGIHGSSSVVYNPLLILRILDPKTNSLLWTTTANVRAGGRQKTRDKQFDQSVAVVVDKLALVTGEQLSPAQLKAISSNSRMSTQMKVLLGVGLASAAGIAIYGAYAFTHRNDPTLPTIPPCPDPPFCPVSSL